MNKNKTFIIAEMACAHEGDISLAKKIIDGAAKADANAIQLQIWELKYMMSPQRSEFDWLKKIEFSHDQWSNLTKYSRLNHPDLDIWVCVYEHQSIDFIDGLGINGYKLNSSDLSNSLVLNKVASTGKPINLSIGASTLNEIEVAIEIIRKNSASKITLMYGFQNFPTAPRDVHLNYMLKLKELFELPIGYQDHCDANEDSAFWLPAASVGMGINTLEKHITHDRSLKGIDHESALNPSEFITFVEMVNIINESRGSSLPRKFSKEEIKYREFQKKSIVVIRDLQEGAKLTQNDIAFMRAEKLGFSPDMIASVIGKVTTRKILAFEPLDEKNIV